MGHGRRGVGARNPEDTKLRHCPLHQSAVVGPSRKKGRDCSDALERARADRPGRWPSPSREAFTPVITLR
jgi:hypothetical protein